MRKFLFALFLMTGIFSFFLSGYVLGQRTFPKNLSFANETGVFKACINHSKLPVEIIIPSLSIDLPVIPSKISGNNWETTTEGVSYLVSSPVPGEKGNSILYGHDFLNLLGKLPKIKPGDEIDIVYNDKTREKFMVKYTSVVSPGQTDILKPSNDRRITLYTCTGFLDSKRFVVIATTE